MYGISFSLFFIVNFFALRHSRGGLDEIAVLDSTRIYSRPLPNCIRRGSSRLLELPRLGTACFLLPQSARTKKSPDKYQ